FPRLAPSAYRTGDQAGPDFPSRRAKRESRALSSAQVVSSRWGEVARSFSNREIVRHREFESHGTSVTRPPEVRRGSGAAGGPPFGASLPSAWGRQGGLEPRQYTREGSTRRHRSLVNRGVRELAAHGGVAPSHLETSDRTADTGSRWQNRTPLGGRGGFQF